LARWQVVVYKQPMHQQLMDQFSLAGRVAVITGAASGIGRETARVLARAGACVVVCDIQEAQLAETVVLVEGSGAKALARRVDVSDRDEIDALAASALQVFGRIDVWVNCAGIMVKRPFLEIDEEILDRGIATNLKSVYWGCIAAGREMKRRGSGSIINVSSGGGESAVPELSIYCMSKAAVNMVTRSAAKELGPYGIRVNAIAPGWIDTPMVAHGFRDERGEIDVSKREEVVRIRRQASPLGLTGEPVDVALAALYLASDASRFVTGQILRPNGGVAMP
jgi:3-oxoacyl-[acyl-carrier protein] reductase